MGTFEDGFLRFGRSLKQPALFGAGWAGASASGRASPSGIGAPDFGNHFALGREGTFGTRMSGRNDAVKSRRAVNLDRISEYELSGGRFCHRTQCGPSDQVTGNLGCEGRAGRVGKSDVEQTIG